MKRTFKKALASVLAGFVTFSTAACGDVQFPLDSSNNTVDGTTVSYLAIDINPSIELLVDGETVIMVKACNDDAAILLSGETLENMNVEDATEKIVALAEELGYLTEDNDSVKITVTADDVEVIEYLQEKVKVGVDKGSELAKVNTVPRSADERKLKELQANGDKKYEKLTSAKLRLIEAIMEYDDTMTYEKGASMSVKELAEMLRKWTDRVGGIVGEEMQSLFKEKFKEAKQNAEQRVAEIYGEEYVAAWERYVALENVMKKIENTAKNVTITEEDIDTLFGILTPETDESSENQQTDSSDIQENRSEDGENVGDQKEQFEDKEHKKEQGKEGKPNGNDGEPFDKHRGEGGNEEDKKDSWKVDDFDKYFDRHCHGKIDVEKWEDIKESVSEILDNYNANDYVLTAEDLAELEAAWGEAVPVTTFGELKEFVKSEMEKLEEMKQQISLSESEKMLIDVAQKVYDDLTETVCGLIQNEMETAKKHFQDIKDDMRKK